MWCWYSMGKWEYSQDGCKALVLYTIYNNKIKLHLPEKVCRRCGFMIPLCQEITCENVVHVKNKIAFFLCLLSLYIDHSLGMLFSFT